MSKTVYVVMRMIGMRDCWVSVPARTRIARQWFDRLATEPELRFLAIADGDGVILREWPKGGSR